MREELVPRAVFVQPLLSERVTLSWEPQALERTGIPLDRGGNTTWVGLVLEFRDTEVYALCNIWRASVEEPRGGSTSLGQDVSKAERFQGPSP